MKKLAVRKFEKRNNIGILVKNPFVIVDDDGEPLPGKNNNFITKTNAESTIEAMIKSNPGEYCKYEYQEKEIIQDTKNCIHPKEKRIFIGGFGHYKCSLCGRQIK